MPVDLGVAQTSYFWGNYAEANYGFNRGDLPPGITENRSIRRHWVGIIEIVGMMLDTYEATRDEAFRDTMLIPLATETFRFYGPYCDWTPDQDHISVIQNALQLMLMQCEGNEILLLPAWPPKWDVDFKLHAPKNTTVECEVKDGSVVKLVVTPASRREDVETGALALFARITSGALRPGKRQVSARRCVRWFRCAVAGGQPSARLRRGGALTKWPAQQRRRLDQRHGLPAAGAGRIPPAADCGRVTHHGRVLTTNGRSGHCNFGPRWENVRETITITSHATK